MLLRAAVSPAASVAMTSRHVGQAIHPYSEHAHGPYLMDSSDNDLYNLLEAP
jgi:hypothetical protein